MSRVDWGDGDHEYGWLYRQHSDAAIGGRRGQAFLREMVSALDSMPAKRLAAEVFVSESGEVCAMGAVALTRGITTDVDAYDPDSVGRALGIAPRLAMEIAYENDREESGSRTIGETGEDRFARMRAWAVRRIKPDPEPSPTGQCSWCMRSFTLKRGRVHSHKYAGAPCPGRRKPPRAVEATKEGSDV